jgi:hypothetical protein
MRGKPFFYLLHSAAPFLIDQKEYSRCPGCWQTVSAGDQSDRLWIALGNFRCAFDTAAKIKRQAFQVLHKPYISCWFYFTFPCYGIPEPMKLKEGERYRADFPAPGPVCAQRCSLSEDDQEIAGNS